MKFTDTFLGFLASAPHVDIRISASADVESGSDTLLELKIAHTDVRVKLCDLDEPTGREIAAWVSKCEEHVQDLIAERVREAREEIAFRRGDQCESDERYRRWFGRGAI